MSAAGPVVLVTGAARGLGAAVVARLVAHGCVVHALDACQGSDAGLPYALATRADLDALAATSDLVTPVVADVRDPAAMAQVVAEVVARDGRLDHVVAAAATIEGGRALWETDPGVLERLWATDVAGVWNTAHASVPHLLPTRGSLVAITSAAASRGLYHLSAYCMAKHAVAGLVRGLAADLEGTGVTVAGVAPGSTDTDMLAATAALYDVSVADLASSQQIGRVLRPDEVASVVEFALFAGPVVHGSLIAAEGGFSG